MVFARDLILFFLRGLGENMSDSKQEIVSIANFKKWPLANDFRVEIEDEKVLSALRKHCSEVEYNDFI